MPNTPKLRKDIARETSAADAGPLLSPGWLRAAAQVATIGIFILMLGIVFSLARGVLRPIAAALIVVIMLGPLASLVVGRRFPPVVFALLVVGTLIALIHLATIVLSGPVANLINVLPTTGPSIAQKFAVFN